MLGKVIAIIIIALLVLFIIGQTKGIIENVKARKNKKPEDDKPEEEPDDDDTEEEPDDDDTEEEPEDD